MEENTMVVLMIGLTATLGCVAFGLGVFVLGEVPERFSPSKSAAQRESLRRTNRRTTSDRERAMARTAL
jgi:hypothetical protein